MSLADLGTMIDLTKELPVLDPVGNKSVLVSGKLSFSVSASDPERQPLKLSAKLEDGRELTGLGATFTDQGDPDGDGKSTGSFAWIPTAAQVGQHRVMFTATDPDGLSDSETITIAVNNPPLTISSLTDSPDPFNPSASQITTIKASFNQPVTSWTLVIKNSAGTEVRKFSYSGSGVTSLNRSWNGTSATGLRVSAGTYAYTLSATAPNGGGTATKIGAVTVQ